MTIEEILINSGNPLIQEIQANMQSAGQNASGQTSQSLKQTVTETDGKIKFVIDADRHFFVLEQGRKAGKQPPISVIQKWIEDKPIRNASKGLAFAIAKKIGAEGSVLFRTGGRTDIFSNVITDDAVASITDKIANFTLKATADSIIETYNKR